MSNARIQFSTASEEKWLQVNPVLREGELVIARKANGKRKLVVGNPGGSSYANSEVVWDAEQAETYMNTTKDLSENVNVFVPHIDSSGILTWTNKAGLDNPSPITIKGIKGDPGEKGEPGQRGEQGAQGIQGPRGIQGEQGERGVQGAQGPAGTAATITIGNVTTSAPGTSAQVINRGTSSAAVLDFVLPKGKDGADGGVTVDDTLSSTSTNPVQNNVIYNALLNKVGTDIFTGFTLMGATAPITWRQGSQVVGSLTASNYTGTALRATQDGDGNTITETYTKKADFDKTISQLGVAFQEKVDRSDLADVATSGKYTDLLNRPDYVVQSVNNVRPDTDGNVTIDVSGSNVTVDTTLSATSTNPIANKAVYNALKDKLDKTAPVYEATKATQDGYGNVITSTYVKKVDLVSYVKTVNNIAPDANGNVNVSGGSSNITIDTTLSATSTNPIANKTVYSALGGKLGKTETAYAATKATQDNAGNVITETYATKADISGVVKSVNGVQPDINGNVSITVSGGSGVSTSTENTWTAQQNFQKMKFNFESYNAPRISGATDNPAASVAVYNVQGNFTLDMSVLAGLLNNDDATLFTAYITANGSYTLSITNAGTLKYAGSANDLAITANGLLLNILLIKSSSGVLSSVAQASTLS
nr:MAG TPA: collagen triple helix repeat protein [Caudoviricetes sp.]